MVAILRQCRPSEISVCSFHKKREDISMTILGYMEEAVKSDESFAPLPMDPSAQIISDSYYEVAKRVLEQAHPSLFSNNGGHG